MLREVVYYPFYSLSFACTSDILDRIACSLLSHQLLVVLVASCFLFSPFLFPNASEQLVGSRLLIVALTYQLNARIASNIGVVIIEHPSNLKYRYPY